MMSSTAPLRNSQNEEFRMVLVGKTGVGKSATGNTILGSKAFESTLRPEAVTTNCQKVRGVVAGRNISVVDTPGLFDTRLSVNKVINEIKEFMCSADPGPHVVFLVVIKLGRFTAEEQESVEMIQTVFREMSNKYTMILFTGGDQLCGKPVEDFLKKSPKLQELIRKCDGHYHVFNNNNNAKDRSQVTELLVKIESMVEVNGRSHYTTEVFQEAERAIQEEQQRILQENEQKRHKEMDRLKKRHAGAALIQAQTQLNTKHHQQSRMQAENNNSFLSNVTETIVKAAAATVAANATASATVDKCSIQ